ncbi:hypothetical protein [Telmatospirillum sp. J64-1]|uniref:hypothetical protein n=1 Tax=Telmatospirillum sp. J64-1 TaxID=2502183 RepID=UPI00115C736E|nr:hypothetical protein [Telmatospirillum sp. J64-1]
MISIPVVEGSVPQIMAARLEAARTLLDAGRRRYGRPMLTLADRHARGWLARAENPLLPELDEMAETLGQPGVHMLNLSVEWGCTTAALPAPDGLGNRMLRTLDWNFRGLGENLLVHRTEGPAGAYYSVTWPGFAGVLTAMAPGRFSVAINQPRHRYPEMPLLGEWAQQKRHFLASRALPGAHLLRRVCEQARDFDEAVAMLRDTPIPVPIFFTVSGLHPDQGCIIERMPDTAALHYGEVICANHWQSLDDKARRRAARRPFVQHSTARREALAAMAALPDGFDWLQPPVLCTRTRVAVVANAARGKLMVLGLDGSAPVTQVLEVQHGRCAEKMPATA